MAKRKSHNHDDEHIDETWLIPYADLLTLLLALFIVLFASSKVDHKKYEELMQSFKTVLSGGNGIFEQTSIAPIARDAAVRSRAEKDGKGQSNALDQIRKETEDLEKLKKQLDDYINENGLTSQLETKLSNQQLMITISDIALFASGSATIKADSKKLAAAISEMLQQYPKYEIEVSGHTDNQPINTAEFQSNWDLSSKRALNFMKILLANSKLDPARFIVIGYGEFRPIKSNLSAAGRATNRRVEVSIIRNIKADDIEAEIH